jgi:hypothetical protein
MEAMVVHGTKSNHKGPSTEEGLGEGFVAAEHLKHGELFMIGGVLILFKIIS